MPALAPVAPLRASLPFAPAFPSAPFLPFVPFFPAAPFLPLLPFRPGTPCVFHASFVSPRRQFVLALTKRAVPPFFLTHAYNVEAPAWDTPSRPLSKSAARIAIATGVEKLVRVGIASLVCTGSVELVCRRAVRAVPIPLSRASARRFAP